ncbi:MAG: deoxyribonuclease IV [Nitrospirae bacterium]|nr:deoxyribonuclease IV [Nitrospirota bacterium]
MRKIGVHTSIAGGLHLSLKRARDLGCNTMQIFTHSPRGWDVKKITDEESLKFYSLRVDLNISPIYVHASYLINLASGDKKLRKKSINLLITEIERADNIGADYVVLHPRSSSGDDKVVSRDRIITALKEVSQSGSWNVGLIIENTAGKRGEISSRILYLSEIINNVGKGFIQGICIDTCHAFASGYDIRSNKGIEQLVEEIKYYVGLDKFKLIHLNDSKSDIGSGIDRHENIGMGKIGSKGLKKFIKNSHFKDVPVILETPKKNEIDDLKNLMKVREMLHENVS